jgi:hypothetical protein
LVLKADDGLVALVVFDTLRHEYVDWVFFVDGARHLLVGTGGRAVPSVWVVVMHARC